MTLGQADLGRRQEGSGAASVVDLEVAAEAEEAAREVGAHSGEQQLPVNATA